MSNWRFLDSVPKDYTTVLFWVPEDEKLPFDKGYAVVGCYDAPLDCYVTVADGWADAVIEPIAWMPLPNGPRSLQEMVEFEGNE